MGLAGSARSAVGALPPAVREPLVRVAREGRRTADRLQAQARRGLARPSAAHQWGFPEREPAAVRLLIGPTNSAGQGYAWARAAERHSPDVAAKALGVANAFAFPTDYAVDPQHFHSARWGADHREYVLSHFTHVVVEAGRTLFGRTLGDDCGPEVPVMRASGLQVALLTHGSDARVPSRHAQRERYSPFTDPLDGLTAKLEATARRHHDLLSSHDGTVLVSTPDLLLDLPQARWCPVVVDLERWTAPPLDRLPDRPVVVHAPSKAALKGTALVDPVLRDLDRRGLITYRRLEGVPASAMPQAYREADIVADQFSLGSYGVAACEALAAGRVVLCHVADEVRELVHRATSLEAPLVESTPQTLEEVITGLVAAPERVAAVSRAGQAYVHRIHDGRAAVDALTPFLARTAP